MMTAIKVKPQTKFAIVLVAAYSLFMLWWFLREDAPKLGTSQAAAVFTTPKVNRQVPVASAPLPSSSLAKGEFHPAGRVVAQASAQHIQPGEVGGFVPYRWPGRLPAYPGEPVTAYVRVPSTKKQEALTVNWWFHS
jgi:hypothetical protein